jgi:hypothetical protein
MIRFLTGLITAVITIQFSSCSFRSVTFSEALRKDTVMYSGNLNNAGPFYVKPVVRTAGRLTQKTLLTTRDESQDVYSFSVCGVGDCIESDSYFYTKTKESRVMNQTRIMAEKMYGTMWFAGRDTMAFMVSVDGRNSGKGFLTLPRNMVIVIQPISKKSNYGKKPYSVGLEFKRDGKIIGAFIQEKESIRIAIKTNESEKMQLVLTALALSLANRSNEIRIL